MSTDTTTVTERIEIEDSDSSGEEEGEEEEEAAAASSPEIAGTKEQKARTEEDAKIKQSQQQQHQNLSSVPVTALGIESARCGGSWSEMPRFAQPGDDWVPLGTCRELNSIKNEIGELIARLRRSKKRARKSRASAEKKPETAAAAAATAPDVQISQTLPADVRKETIRELKEISDRIGAARDSLHECFAEAVRALMVRRANPEILGYGMLLQATPDPPEWAKREKIAPERKHKKPVPPPPSADLVAAAAAATKEPPRALRQLTLDAVLGEKLPLRSEHSKKQ